MSIIQHDDFVDTMPMLPITYDASRHRPDPRPEWATLLTVAIAIVAVIVVLVLSF
jgi:hypothetical protein